MTHFHFSYTADWRLAPLAFWVHVPTPAGGYQPAAPPLIAHRGYRLLHIPFERVDLVFSSLAQLDHMLAVLASRPLPTSRQLSARRGWTVGPNGHWLSRLPAHLKSPRRRAKLVQVLQRVRAQVTTKHNF